ncbi:MAG: hypothetical protein ACRD5R_00320 [Candidatus Acidiferrales bacterium]
MKATFRKWTVRLVAGGSVLLFLFVASLFSAAPAQAIPAFARKYGLPCSACHVGWPELTNFGQVFRDNGYQMMNDRDSPITRDASYFPATIRITPQWHLESASNQTVDSIVGGGAGSNPINKTINVSGFDLSGMDMWFAGTLFKNISFSALPSSDSTASWHFENAYVRFDNIKGSSWFNFKVGKFELDLPVSEKRLLTMSGNGGFYYIYHFSPVGDANPFGGIGDNQLGMELSGHNANSYTRYAFSVVSSEDGQVGLPQGRTFDIYGHFDQAFNVGSSGYMKVGAYAYFGQAPTYFQTTGGGSSAIGPGLGNKPFYRAGAEWKWYLNKWIFKGVYLHGYENAFLATATPATSGNTLPVGGQAASWNGGFLEGQYVFSPQWIIIGRYETVRMSQQAFTTTPGNLGNLDAFTIASRYYPIMFSRAGLALQQEYSFVRSNGITNQGGAFGQVPLGPGLNVNSSSVFLGVDFDF